MTERELKKLRRTDLLELLLEQRKENERLMCVLDQTQAQLTDRRIQIDNAGSIAEASLQLGGIFNAAQESCQYYMENIKLLSERQGEVCKQMEEETKAKCDRMVAEAEKKSQEYWNECSAKIRQLVESFEGLQMILDTYESIQKKGRGNTGNISGKMY